MNEFRRDQLEQKGPKSPQSGFTLIELLIALTLFGLLSVALLGGLRFGTRVWETGHERSAAFFEVEAVHGFLRKQLSQARVLAQASDTKDDTPIFLGTSERVLFVAPLPEYVGLGGLYRFELTHSDDSDGSNLVLSWELYRPDRESGRDEDSISRRILLKNIDTLKIRYYGTLGPDAGAEWQVAWDGAGRLPLLIALDLNFPKSDVRTWPNFVVAPFVAQDEPHS
jgi:general secretion pathway protein J